MAELLLEYQGRVRGPDGRDYIAQAWGEPTANGRWWLGWLEFLPVRGGTKLRTSRETTQPNRTDTEYWASGIEPVYLGGALVRAMERAGRDPTPVVEMRKVESRNGASDEHREAR